MDQDKAYSLNVTDAPDPLAQLIQSAMDRQQPRSWTVADLQRKTGLGYTTIKALLEPKPAGSRKLTRPQTLDTIADALGIPRPELLRAAQVAAGYAVVELDFPDDPEFRVFLARYRELEGEERERLMRVVRRIADDPDLFPPRKPDGE